MPYSLDDKLVIAVSANALFDFAEAATIFDRDGLDAYKSYQREHESDVIPPGTAFPFIRRLLSLNNSAEGFVPVEVVLLSKNSPDAALPVIRSVAHYKLPITRQIFTGGGSRLKYIPVLKASLFLSSNEKDVREATQKGHAAGLVVDTAFVDDEDDKELRIAFDFDGILADDSAERVYKARGLAAFLEAEAAKESEPLPPGPLKELLAKIAFIQREDIERHKKDRGYQPRIRTAIFTARNAPAHVRAIKTLRHWGIEVDEAAFLGGIDKAEFLRAFRAHIFFDDQMVWAGSAANHVPSVHIPFGVANAREDRPPEQPAPRD